MIPRLRYHPHPQRAFKMADYKTVGVGDISFLVKKTGLSDPSLRLVIGLLAGYPLALVYRLFLYRKNAFIQHVYFIICGLSLLIFNFGWGAMHSVVNIFLVYLVLLTGGPGIMTVVSVFILNFVYLLSGYIVNATGGYDVNWTTPHCVLCLRLISLAWDYYDGGQDQETLSADYKTTALDKLPSILEVYGTCYFMGGILVGPLFPIKNYIKLVEGKLIDQEDDNNSCIAAGFKRLLGGILYLGVYAVLGLWFTDAYLLSQDFKKLSYMSKIWYIGFWGRILLMRYLGVWLCAEGSCIIPGLAFNGKTPQGELQWDGLRNIKISIYETSYTFQHIVESFNINTNKWVFRYCFKRLRFLGNKNLSHFLALMFLAVWHGLFLGYFISFFFEFTVIMIERQIYLMCIALSNKRWADMSPSLKALVIAISWPIRFCGFAYTIIPFNFLTWDKINEVFYTTYYTVPVALAVLYTLYIIAILLKPKLGRTTDSTTSKERLKKAE